MADDEITVEIEVGQEPSATVDVPPDPDVIVVEVEGLMGPEGPPGLGSGFEYRQSAAAAVWTIAHNFGIRPGVSTFNEGGIEIEGHVQHISKDVLIVSFNIPVSGYAHLI